MTRGSYSRIGELSIYDVVSAAYVAAFGGSYLVHTNRGYRVRSLWRERHEQHIGSAKQLQVPLGSFVTYCAFWAIVLAAKLAFDYTFVLSPLKEPIMGLLYYPFPRLM